jgi:hypothetical protein
VFLHKLSGRSKCLTRKGHEAWQYLARRLVRSLMWAM